jgi:hypothetical protein
MEGGWGSSHTHAQNSLGQTGVESILQLQLVNIDRDISYFEMDQSAGMVEMKMPHSDGFDVFDAITSLLICFLKFLVFGVVHSGEEVVKGSSPDSVSLS